MKQAFTEAISRQRLKKYRALLLKGRITDGDRAGLIREINTLERWLGLERTTELKRSN